MRKNHCKLSVAVLAALLLLITPLATAAGEADEQSFSRKGADTCLGCHDEDSDYPVMDIFYTPHGSQSDEGAPMAGLQCETCHGAGSEHSQRIRSGEERPEITMFGLRTISSSRTRCS